eukprot:7379520-Prymnesium_polylepis.3
MSCPVARSQMHAFPPTTPVASVLPSGANDTAITIPSCAKQCSCCPLRRSHTTAFLPMPPVATSAWSLLMSTAMTSPVPHSMDWMQAPLAVVHL